MDYHKRQVFNPPYQALQGLSIAKPRIVLLNIWVENINLTFWGPVVIYSILYFFKEGPGAETS